MNWNIDKTTMLAVIVAVLAMLYGIYMIGWIQDYKTAATISLLVLVSLQVAGNGGRHGSD